MSHQKDNSSLCTEINKYSISVSHEVITTYESGFISRTGLVLVKSHRHENPC